MVTICDLAKEAGIAFYTRNFKRFEKLTKEAIKKALPNAKVVFLPTNKRDKVEPDIEFIPSKNKNDKFTVTVVYKKKNFIPITADANISTEEVRWFYIAAVLFELIKIYVFVTNKSYRKKIWKYALNYLATSTIFIGLPTVAGIYYYLKLTAGKVYKEAVIVAGLFGFLLSALTALSLIFEKDVTVQTIAEEFGCSPDEADTIANYEWMKKYLVKAYKTSYVEVKSEIRNYNYNYNYNYDF